jgi:hypothetical protein
MVMVIFMFMFMLLFMLMFMIILVAMAVSILMSMLMFTFLPMPVQPHGSTDYFGKDQELFSFTGSVAASDWWSLQVALIDHEYGKFPARNARSFAHYYFVANISSLCTNVCCNLGPGLRWVKRDVLALG